MHQLCALWSFFDQMENIYCAMQLCVGRVASSKSEPSRRGFLRLAVRRRLAGTSTGKEAQEAVVTVDGEVYGTYSLAKDQTIEIQDGNRLRIQNGQAKMEWADCPDQLCVHQKAISRTGESIICLPNQVVVSVQGSKEGKLDGIVN